MSALSDSVPGDLPGDFDEELLADGAEEPLDLPAALRAARGGVNQPDAELRARPQQPSVDEREPLST